MRMALLSSTMRIRMSVLVSNSAAAQGALRGRLVLADQQLHLEGLALAVEHEQHARRAPGNRDPEVAALGDRGERQLALALDESLDVAADHVGDLAERVED